MNMKKNSKKKLKDNILKKINIGFIAFAILLIGAIPVMADTQNISETGDTNVPLSSKVSPSPGTLWIPSRITLTHAGETSEHIYEGEYWAGSEGYDIGNYGVLTISCPDGLVMTNEDTGTKATATLSNTEMKISVDDGYARFGDQRIIGNASVTFEETGEYSGIMTFHLTCEEKDN